MAAATRWGGLRPEPYDPDAVDADGDTIVQEGTAFERPAGTRIVDEFGQALARGLNATERGGNWKVVSADGSEVPYTPTYARPGAQMPKPGSGTPLADHGARSLKEFGLPTIQSLAAPAPPPTPQPLPDVPKAPDVPSPAAAVEAAIPEKPKRPYDVPPIPMTGKTAELADAADGDWGKFREEVLKHGLVVFDYETTGFSKPNNNRPVQIGAVRVGPDGVTERLNLFVNPGEPLSQWSKDNLKDADGNPLTDEFLAKQMSIAEAHQQLAEFMGDSIIAAHNLPFDQKVLETSMRDSGIDFTPGGTLDTLELARQLLPKGDGKDGTVSSHSLGALTEHYGIPNEGWHTADADAVNAAKIFDRMIDGAVVGKTDGKMLTSEWQKERFTKATAEHGTAMEKYKADLAAYEHAIAKGGEGTLDVPTVDAPKVESFDPPIPPARPRAFDHEDWNEKRALDDEFRAVADEFQQGLAAEFGLEDNPFVQQLGDSVLDDGTPMVYRKWPDDVDTDEQWFAAASKFIEDSDLDPDKKQRLLTQLADAQAVSEIGEPLRWTYQPESRPGYRPPPRPPRPPGSEDWAPVEPPKPPYDEAEAQRLFTEGFSRLSPERQKAIRDSVFGQRDARDREKALDKAYSEVGQLGYEQKEKMTRKPRLDQREYDPPVGAATRGVRGSDATSFGAPDPESPRQVTELQSKADQVLVKAGDLTDEKHQAEAIDLLASDRMTRLVEDIDAARERQFMPTGQQAARDKPLNVTVPNDPTKYGQQADMRQESGAPVRGTVMDPAEVPDVMFHVTTNGLGVARERALLAGGKGGLNGDAGDQMVSLTTDADVADNLEGSMKLMSQIARQVGSDDERGPERSRKIIGLFQDAARAEGWEWDPRAAETQLQNYRFGDWANEYFMRRESVHPGEAKFRNPVFTDTTVEQWSGVDPTNIRRVVVSRDDVIGSGALVTNFDVGQGGLEEVRVYGDVPIANAAGNFAGAYTSPGKAIVEALVKERGFDGSALIASEGEIDEMVGSGYKELSRGGAGVVNEQHLRGDLLIGNGLDGAGLYFATQTFHPEGDQKVNPHFDAASYGRSSGEGGTVLRGVLNPSARITGTTTVSTELDNYKASQLGQPLPSPNYANRLATMRTRLADAAQSDPKAAAALRNLDRILLDSADGENANPMSVAALLIGFDGIVDNPSGSNRTILYNRSAAVMSEIAHTPDGFDEIVGYENFKSRQNARIIARGDLPLDATSEQYDAWRDLQIAKMMREFDEQRRIAEGG